MTGDIEALRRLSGIQKVFTMIMVPDHITLLIFFPIFILASI